jgi:hypothetical protein
VHLGYNLAHYVDRLSLQALEVGRRRICHGNVPQRAALLCGFATQGNSVGGTDRLGQRLSASAAQRALAFI